MNYKEYLTDHSLDEAFITKNFGVQLSEDTITIPIYGVDKKLLYCKYRHLKGEAKFTFDKGGHPAIFCLHKVKNKEWIVLAEGEPDVMRLWQEGIPAVTATAGVKTFNTELAKPLANKEVFVCLDNDEAGQKEVRKYCDVLESVGATPLVVSLPEAFKDVSVFFTQGGTKELFEQIMGEALPFKEWKKAHQKEEYKIETMFDVKSEQMSPEAWLIDKVIPAEGFVFIVGAEATGKSFYTLTIANALCSGKPWLGHFAVKKMSKVLFIDKENTRRRTQNRLRGLGITDEAAKGMFRLKYAQYFQLEAGEGEESVDGFSEFAHQASELVKDEGIGLVIIDSFADIMVGNENAAGDVQKFFDGFRQLFPNVAILVLHHDNKPQAGVTRTSSQRMRGSSNIAAQIVVGFRSTAIPKTKTEFALEQIKAGDMEKMNPFKVKLIVETDPVYDGIGERKTLVTDVVYQGEYFDEQGKIVLAKDAIADLFTENPTMLRQEIIDGVMASNGGDVSPRSIATALKQMVDDEVLEIQKDGRKSRYMWLGEDEKES